MLYFDKKGLTMENLLFGTAGIPIDTEPHNLLNGIRRVNTLELDCMELEFVRSIYLKKSATDEVKAFALEQNVLLTCHAPFFINLNSPEEKKVLASMIRIIDSADITNLCGGISAVFHPGFYLQSTKEEALQKIIYNLSLIREDLDRRGNPITLRPEITGKESQFGDIDEVIELSKHIKGVLPCIDFAHYHARYNGIGSYKEFSLLLEKMAKALGDDILKNMHIHVSGIEYTAKGERRHLNLRESDFPYNDFIKVLQDYKVAGVIICESPNIEEDAIFLKNLYYK